MSNQPSMMYSAMRLIVAPITNSKNLTYYIAASTARAIFDGDVMLEPECYVIDAARNKLILKRPSVFEIKILAAAAHD